jgi:cytoskeletal protein CcmA (bactofilin family)
MALFGKKGNEERPPVVQPPAAAAPKITPKEPTPDATQETTYFGKNLKITGNISGEGSTILLGSFEGEFNLNGHLKVAQGARIKGSVKATEIYINGSVDGTIEASKKIHLDNTATVKGRIIAPKISILEGSVFDGEIQMSGRSAQASKPITPESAKTATTPAASDKK